ncbi:MAG: gamma-glutamyl-gamma-aminobutyrate hydrolase family protein [Firmicutes bacterium]|nr:gamma-glutamyl-gamma-aminobutyrate hydrolase family protein [Bacillota bacterium]
MARPLIGITTAHNLQEDYFFCRGQYIEGIEREGGSPLLLPPVRDEALIKAYAELIDGLLLSGGGDLHPLYFGEEPHWKLGEVSPERDHFEVRLIQEILATGKPVLGICRGIQVLNAALGGTLYQDLQSQLPHSLQHQQEAPRRHPTHKIRVLENSRLARVLGTTELRVNSLHHQAVKDVAPGVQAVAWAEDGVIEGIEAPDYSFLVGVQWHPEALRETDKASAALFRALIEAAAKSGRN